MASWSQPNTKEKAVKLAALMGKPIHKAQSLKSLYYILGSDELYESIFSCEENEDIRPLVRCYLRGMIANLHQGWNMWDEEAIATLKQLVSQDQYMESTCFAARKAS